MAVIENEEALKTVMRNRRVLNTEEGRAWLADFLVANHFWDSLDPSDTEAIVRHNVCLEVLYGLGSLQDMNIPGYVEAIADDAEAKGKKKTRLKELVDRFLSLRYTKGEE